MKVQARPARGKVDLSCSAPERLWRLCNALAESVVDATDEEIAEEGGGDPERVRTLLLRAAKGAQEAGQS